MKYIVMECHLSYAVVLDEEGRFLKVANMRYEEGQTLDYVIEMSLPESDIEIEKTPEPENKITPSVVKKKNKFKWIYTLAGMAACVVLAITAYFQTGVIPYASVYMTINPQVRIDVNRKDMVVNLEGMNTDGEQLIEAYSYKKKDLDVVMDELVDLAIDMGYLSEGGKITLTLEAEDGEWVVSHSESLKIQLDEHLNDNMKVDIELNVYGDNNDDLTNDVPDNIPEHHQVVIPIGPEMGDSDYGDSSYDDVNADDGQSDYSGPVVKDGQSIYNESVVDDGQTDYGTVDDGQSDYDAQSNYGASDYD